MVLKRESRAKEKKNCFCVCFLRERGVGVSVTSRVVRLVDLRGLRRESSCWHVAEAAFFYFFSFSFASETKYLCCWEHAPKHPLYLSFVLIWSRARACSVFSLLRYVPASVPVKSEVHYESVGTSHLRVGVIDAEEFVIPRHLPVM